MVTGMNRDTRPDYILEIKEFGKGIVNKIMTMLEVIPFGKHYFEVGIILRNSLLVSSMLFNSEAWYNITKAELDLFETIDLLLLQQLLNAPKGHQRK